METGFYIQPNSLKPISAPSFNDVPIEPKKDVKPVQPAISTPIPVPQQDNKGAQPSNWLRFFLIILIALFVANCFWLTHEISEGKLQTKIDQDINTQVNSTTNNEYDFSPTTNNQFTTQLNVTLVLPQTLNINAVNITHT